MPKPKATRADVTPARKPSGALAKSVMASTKLAAIVGSTPLPRLRSCRITETNPHAQFQDPTEARTFVDDNKLRAAFGQDRATMIEMQNIARRACDCGLNSAAPLRLRTVGHSSSARFPS